MKTADAVAVFLVRCRARKLSPKTIEAYGWALGYLGHLVDLPEAPGDVEVILDVGSGRLGNESLFDLWRRWRTFFRWVATRYDVSSPMERVNPRTGRSELLVERPVRAKKLPRDLCGRQRCSCCLTGAAYRGVTGGWCCCRWTLACGSRRSRV